MHRTLPWLAIACADGDLGVRTPTTPDSGTAPSDTAAPSSTDTATPSTTTPPTADTGTPPARRPFLYVGSGDDRIHVFRIDPASGVLTDAGSYEAGASPTFLAASPDRRTLYAVNEGSDQLSAFAIDPSTGGLTLLNRVPSNGSGPAHVAVDATGTVVFGANYGGGSVTMVRAEADGRLGAALATRSTGANAHALAVDPSNRFAFVPNLGDDDVSQLVFDPVAGTLVESAVPTVSVADGAGPRHLAFHPTAPFAYLIDETDDTMVAMAFDGQDGQLAAIQTLSTLPDGADGSASYCAEVAFEPTGRFLYGSNRGHDSVVIFAVDAVSGRMTLAGHQDTGGSWPRHFGIDPSGSFLFVGNQQSDTVVSFRIDPVDGTLSEIEVTAVTAPAFAGVVDLP